MGAESLGAVPEDTKFTDAKVCRNFLCGTCPHDLFTNTVSIPLDPSIALAVLIS